MKSLMHRDIRWPNIIQYYDKYVIVISRGTVDIIDFHGAALNISGSEIDYIPEIALY